MSFITFEITIEKHQEGTYFPVAFNVPAGVESLIISYEYRRIASHKEAIDSPVNIVDLGVLNAADVFLGWSGSSRRQIEIGEFSSTPGYLHQPINEGPWSVLIGAYKIQSSGLSVHYRVEFIMKKARWLYGDIHMHSTASDGKLDRTQVIAKAKKIGLDFIAITDHNNYSENLVLPRISGLTLIPGVEWTHYQGHMNFYGTSVPFSNSFVVNNESEMKRLIQKAKELGTIISVNHPKDRYCPYLWADDECFDMLEVWNGPMRSDNVKALNWWIDFLNKGRRIPIVGGSDFHRNRNIVRMGNPITAVYAKSPSPDDTLKALLAGHSYVTSSLKGPRLELIDMDLHFGDTLKISEPTQIAFVATSLSWGMCVKVIYNNKENIYCKHHSVGKIALEIEVEKSGYIFFIVLRRFLGKQRIEALSNPLYIENRQDLKSQD